MSETTELLARVDQLRAEIEKANLDAQKKLDDLYHEIAQASIAHESDFHDLVYNRALNDVLSLLKLRGAKP